MNEHLKEIEKQLEIMRQANAQFIEDWNYMNSPDFKFEVIPNKYYWLLVGRETFSGKQTHNYVSKEHPFSYVRSLYNPQLQEEKIILLNWKEITKEEYELFKQPIV